MGEKLQPGRHSRQDMTSTLLLIAGRWGGSLLQQAKVPGDHLAFQYSPSTGQLPRFWPTFIGDSNAADPQGSILLSRAKSRLPQHRKQWRTPFPRFQRAAKSSPCIRQRTVGIPTQYIDAIPGDPRTVITSHVTLFSLMHVCSCPFASSCSWHAQPLSAHPPHRPYSFLYLSCGYKLPPRKAAPAAHRQPKLRPCSSNGYGLGKRRYCGVGAFAADATTMSVRCGVG